MPYREAINERNSSIDDDAPPEAARLDSIGLPLSIGRGVTVVRVRVQLRKPKKTTRREPAACEVYRLKSSPAAFIGVLYADDKASASAAAIKERNIRPADQKRLLARPR